MSNITLEARIYDPKGRTLLYATRAFVDAEGPGLDYVVNAGEESTLVMGLSSSVPESKLPKDARIGIWKSINGGPMRLDAGSLFFLREWTFSRYYTKIKAYHANSLLKRRIVAYPDGTLYATKDVATYAGNMLKAYVRENMGTLIVAADRDGGSSAQTGADVSAYLTIEPDRNDGAQVTMSTNRRSLFYACQDICKASALAGTYLVFQIVASSPQQLTLKTFQTALGTNHGLSSKSPVTISGARGTLNNPHLFIDASQEVTAVIAGGAGSEDERLIMTSLDTALINALPFGRFEEFYSVASVDDEVVLQDAADARLREKRSYIVFTGDLNETDSLQRGIHYDFGDILIAEAFGQKFNVRMDVFRMFVQNKKVVQQIYLRSPI